MSVFTKRILASGAASLIICGINGTTHAQTSTPAENPPATAPAENAPATAAPPQNGPTVLPETRVAAPKQAAKPAKRTQRVVSRGAATPPQTPPPLSPAAQLEAKSSSFDQSRSNLYTTAGTTSDTISHDAIQNLPQGAEQPVEKVLLQAPGVSQDSAASGLLHVRNDHANVQFRINGVMLPDGVTGFGSIFDTSFIGSMALVTGALPAEFGLRTVGLVDINTRNDIFNNSGSVSMYGGSHGTISPSFEYGGTYGGNCAAAPAAGTTPTYVKAPPAYADCFPGVQYYLTGRYLQTTVGLESATPGNNAIHDFSQQERGFAYMSAFVDPTTRVSLIAGTSINNFEIPDVPGKPISPSVAPAFGASSFNSAQLNENQWETTHFGVLSVQTSANGLDTQLSYFTRYNNLHFLPDPTGDLLLNGIASTITRTSYTNGIQGDASYQLNSAHTLRTGFTVSGEQVFVGNSSVVEPCMICDGTDSGAPETITDNVSKLGVLMGVYAQDEWKLTNQLTVNAGLRFDQMYQFTDANQFSPRLSITYKPFENTTFHAGYARYFTPPTLVEAAPANIGLFANTTGAPNAGQANDPVLPERSHYFDAGVDQKIPLGCTSPSAKDCSSLDLGVDAYYKIATDLIDNGLFGQALVLSAFNYARGYNEGIEFHAKYNSGNFQAYANVAVAQQRANDPVSNQYLFDNTTPLADLGGLTEFKYLQTNFIYTDHNQFVTASAGASYQFCGRAATSAEAFEQLSWCGTTLSADAIYGSGLRNGDANISTVPAYTQVNVGIKREFLLPNDPKPMTVRFDIVNLFDEIYEIRDGSGIGVFAPQFGPRRGFFLGISKKI